MVAISNYAEKVRTY